MDKDRTYHRFSVPGARLKGPTFDAPVVNLSKTGMAILTERELEPGDSYAAWLSTDADQSWVEGRVVWCAPKVTPGGAETSIFEVGLSVQAIASRDAPGAPDRARPDPSGEGAVVALSESAKDPPSADRQPGASRQLSASPKRGVRSAPRVDVSGMRLRADDLDADVANFSSRGLAIRADRELEAGQAFDARLETLDGTVFLTAIVVWCRKHENSFEGARPSFAAGLSLSDVDQRLHPLGDELTPAAEELDAIEWPEPAPEPAAAPAGSTVAPVIEEAHETEASSEIGESSAATAGLEPLTSPEIVAQAEAGARPEAGEMPPWLAEVTETLEIAESRPTRQGMGGRRTGIAILAVAVLALLLWLFTRPDAEDAAMAESVSSPSGDQAPDSVIGSGLAVTAAAEAPASTIATESDRGAEADSIATPAQAVLGTVVPRVGVNVRGGPGLDYPVVRRTDEGERLPFVARQGEWFRLRADQESWLHEVTVLAVEESPESALN